MEQRLDPPDAGVSPAGVAPAGTRRELASRAIAWIAVAGVAALALWAMNVVPYLPTNDGPEHVLQSYVQLHFDDEGTLYRSYLAPLPELAERGFSTVFRPLLAHLEWRAALRVTLSAAVLLYGLALVLLARALGKDRVWVGVVGFSLAFGWPLYMGFFPFVLATGAGLAVVAQVVSRPPRGLLAHALLALLLLALAFCHVGVAAFTGLVVACVELARAQKEARAATLGRLALVGAPALVVLALAVASSAEHATPEVTSLDFVPVETRVQELPRLLAPGPGLRALALWSVVVVGVVAAIVRWHRRTLPDVEKGLLVGAAILLALGVLGPRSIPGWQHFSPRFLPLGAALAVALVPLEQLGSRVGRWAARVGLVALCATALLGSARLHVRLADGCADAIAGLDARVSRRGLVLPLLLDPYCAVERDPRTSEVPYLAPLLHMGGAYVASHGGMPAYMFANVPAVHAFRFLPREQQPPTPERPPGRFWVGIDLTRFRGDPIYRRERIERLVEYAVAWESLVVLGARPEDAEQLRARRFVADWASGSALIGAFVPCPLSVVVDARARTDAPVIVDYALDPTSPRLSRIVVDPARSRGGEARAELPRAACGAAWVRMLRDEDRSGGPSAGDRVCRSPRPDAFRSFSLTGPTRVTCDDWVALP